MKLSSFSTTWWLIWNIRVGQYPNFKVTKCWYSIFASGIDDICILVYKHSEVQGWINDYWVVYYSDGKCHIPQW